MRHSIEEARQRYAEELRFTARLRSRPVVEAFATVTNAERWGCFLMITRQPGDPCRYAARFAGRVGIIPWVGGRDPAAEEKLTAALAGGDFTAIRSLRRAPEEPDHTCWLAGEGWWLSTTPPAPVEAR